MCVQNRSHLPFITSPNYPDHFPHPLHSNQMCAHRSDNRSREEQQKCQRPMRRSLLRDRFASFAARTSARWSSSRAATFSHASAVDNEQYSVLSAWVLSAVYSDSIIANVWLNVHNFNWCMYLFLIAARHRIIRDWWARLLLYLILLPHHYKYSVNAYKLNVIISSIETGKIVFHLL
jgi:hypothetical protein